MGIMYKLKNILSARSLTTLYYALVHPYLSYGIQVWRAPFETNLKRMQIFQNKTMKIIGGGKYRVSIKSVCTLTEPVYLKCTRTLWTPLNLR